MTLTTRRSSSIFSSCRLIPPGGAVYVAVYAREVRRTNIYLTDDEQAALDARAAVEGSTRSEVVRAIVDRELNLGSEGQTELDAALAAVAAELAERSRVLSRDDVDLHIS